MERFIVLRTKAASQPIQIQEIRKIINDVVRTGALKFLTGGIAVGDAAGLGAGATPHQDVKRHVPYNKGSLRAESQFPQRQKNRLGIRLGLRHVIRAQNKREFLVKAESPDQIHQRAIETGRRYRKRKTSGA